MWRMQDMAEGFFLRLRLYLWAQAEPNVFFTSCEFKAFRLIHKVSVPKSAPPSLYMGSPMHPHARKHRRAPPLRPSSGGFSPRRAQGALPSARGREKSSGLWSKTPLFSAKNSPLFRCVHHFCTDRSAFGREKAHSGTKKVISLHLLSLKSGKVAPAKGKSEKKTPASIRVFVPFKKEIVRFHGIKQK